MSILILLVILIVLALAIYGVRVYLPGDAALKGVICFGLIAVACVAILAWAGILPGMTMPRGGLRW